MTTLRPTQLSMVEGMDRPTGRILPSVFTGTNADLMAAVAPLYLTGSVLDVTYGNGDTAGGWWRRFTPEPFTFHDLALDGVDFRALPEANRSVDTVCFDPPYVSTIGSATSSRVTATFRDVYGLRSEGYSRAELWALIQAGLAECARVSRRFLLVKCMEFAKERFVDMPTDVTIAARALGWTKHDQIVHHTGPGPGGHNITEVKRARRAHSYLLVFTPEVLR